MKNSLQLLFAALLCASTSAGAEVIIVPAWEEPGRFAYDNASDPDHTRVAKLHQEAHGLSEAEFMRGTRMVKAGECTTRRLNDGEVLWTSFSGASGHHVKQVRVAFQEGHSRQVTDCDLGNGVHVLLPAVCNNWSVQYRTVLLPPTPEESPVTESCRCFRNDSSTVYSGTYVSGVSGTYLPGCNPDFVPGVATSPYVEQSAGQTCICQ